MAKWVYLMHSPQWQLTNSFSWMLTERKTRAAVRARPSKYEDSPFTPPGRRGIGCFLITVLAIVNFISRPFWNIGAVAMTHISPVDWVLYTSLAWQWWIAEAPLIFSGLSMMKLPFHTMERSTARSLIFTPSYMYWKAEKQSERECGKWIQTKRKLKWERGLSNKKKRYREMGWKGRRETRLLTICHFCHGCLLLSSLTCGDANPGWGGWSSTSEETGLFIYCHTGARYALHGNIACDLHSATKISVFIPNLGLSICQSHHIHGWWTPICYSDNLS